MDPYQRLRSRSNTLTEETNLDDMQTLYDVCRVAILIFQCDKYRKGVIGGSACSSLCEKDTLYLGKCFTAKPDSQVSVFIAPLWASCWQSSCRTLWLNSSRCTLGAGETWKE